MSELVEVSVERIYEALSKSGFEHLRGKWSSDDVDGVIIGGCILQQGALNLSVWADEGEDSPDGDYEENETGQSLLQVLNSFEVPRNSKWYIGESLGSTIVHWNDKIEGDSNGWKTRYVLKTYAEVLAMAKDLLLPYFGKTVLLEKKVYNFKRDPKLIFQGAQA